MDDAAHVVADQERVFRLLGSSETYGSAKSVIRIDTHGAIVFLVGEDAYKVKRAVRFPFMDFSSLEKRRRACEAEVAINRAYAPEIYLGILPVVYRDGALQLGGDGAVVEWTVHMRRFDEEKTLDKVVERDGLAPDLIGRLAVRVADAHAQAAGRSDIRFVDALRRIIHDNKTGLVEMSDIFDAARVDVFTAASLAALDRVAEILEVRAATGYVRRCHGDLHLRNIVLIDGMPTLFDAIEFDEALATVDILYDLAFLLMDIGERQLPFEANLLLNRYLVEGNDRRQMEGLAALPVFIAVRAAIRAKVIAAGLHHLNAREKRAATTAARRYFDYAARALEPSRPMLVAIGGLSGTGKSTLAARLAPHVGMVPGAVHLRSDVVRKHLHGVPELARLPAEAYDSASTNAVHESLCEQAEMVLRAGQSVVVDATYLHENEREGIRQVAEKCRVPFRGLWLEAPLDVVVDRINRRREDASDADAAVAKAQVHVTMGPVNWRRIDASGELDAVIHEARAALAK